MDNEKAKRLDDILRRFKGNATIKWSDLQNELKDSREYYLTENNIKYLLGDGMLTENKAERTISLSDKGFAVYADIENEGYFKKSKKEKRDKWIKNIGFVLTIATFLILLYRTFNTQTPVEKRLVKSNKTIVDITTIDSMIITNNPLGRDSVARLARKMSSEQIEVFVDKWNDANSMGLCKYFTTYQVDLYLKNGANRSFRVNGQNIKEGSDFCFDLGDESYIEREWGGK